MYESTGKKAKEFFYLQKSMALAEAVMWTANAVTKALGVPPYGPMALAGAAVISTMGAAQIATILASTFAEGGEVKGKSPHKKADNIPAWLTANEFVQPVDTVQYYGKGVMEALRRRVIPRELFQGYTIPTPKFSRGGIARFAEGGMAAGSNAMSKAADMPQAQQKIDIVNVVDENMMQKYIASNSGKEALFNIIRSNSYEFKNALATEM